MLKKGRTFANNKTKENRGNDIIEQSVQKHLQKDNTKLELLKQIKVTQLFPPYTVTKLRHRGEGGDRT